MADSARSRTDVHEEIGRTRDRLAHTIDTLAERAAPKKLVEDAKQQAVACGNDAAQLARQQAQDGIQYVREHEAVRRAQGMVETYGPVVRANSTYILAGVGVLTVGALLAWGYARKRR